MSVNSLSGFIQSWSNWAALDYEITLIYILGKEGIRCTKKIDGRLVVCEQIYEHAKLVEKFDLIVSFMVTNIDQQIATNKFHKPISGN